MKEKFKKLKEEKEINDREYIEKSVINVALELQSDL